MVFKKKEQTFKNISAEAFTNLISFLKPLLLVKIVEPDCYILDHGKFMTYILSYI